MVRGKGKKSSETQRGPKGTEKGREGKEGERREEELNEGGREEREGEGLTKSLQCISGRAMASNAGPLLLGKHWQALMSTSRCSVKRYPPGCGRLYTPDITALSQILFLPF